MYRKIETALGRIDDRFIAEAAQIMNKEKFQKRKITRIAGRSLAAAAALLITMTAGLTVAVGKGSLPAYTLLHAINPIAAESLTPVNESCEDNGIRMTVEAVNVEGNTADVYVSMRDIESDRLDETTDLFDSYSIHTTADQAGGCSFVSYDADTHTATFLISIEQDRPITGRKLEFSVSELLTGKREDICTLPLTNAAEVGNTMMSESEAVWSCGGSSMTDDFDPMTPMKVLVPDTERAYAPVDGVLMTGWGLINGRLHVQIQYQNTHTLDNHGWVYLQDKNGDTVQPIGHVAFGYVGHEEEDDYNDYIFESLPDPLDSYRCIGAFTTCTTNIKGDWHVSVILR